MKESTRGEGVVTIYGQERSATSPGMWLELLGCWQLRLGSLEKVEFG